MRRLLTRLALAYVRPVERSMRAYLRRAIAEDPAFREWVWSQEPSLQTVLALGLDDDPPATEGQAQP